MTRSALQRNEMALNLSIIAADEPAERPDVVLPVQFFATMRRRLPNKTGEYRLLVAVLEEAIQCFQQHASATGRRGRRLFAEVETWIMDESIASRTNRNAPRLSFEYICGVLGLDPGWLRQGLQRWRAAHVSPGPPPAQVVTAPCRVIDPIREARRH